MNEKSTVLNPKEKETWTPPVPAAKKFRWQPSVEFVLTMALIGDALVVFAALSLGYWVRFESGWIPFYEKIVTLPTFFDYIKPLAMGTVFMLGTFGYLRLYSQHCFMRYLRTARVIVQGTVFWLFAYLAVSLILKFDPPISRLFMASSFVCVMGAMFGWRLIFFKIMRWEIFAFNMRQRVLFVGWGKEAEQLEKEIRNDYSHPYEIVGCLPSPSSKLHLPPPPDIRILGDYQHLPTLLGQRCADVVILADLHMNMGEIIGLINLCEKEFAQFKIIPSYFQTLASGLRLETISGIPVLGVSELSLESFPNRTLKRGIDILGATVGLLLSAPLIAIMGWLIWRESPGNIFFYQERIGRGGRKFKMYKLRSMKLGADATDHIHQSTLRDDPRFLRCGAFMRRWNIDEVPQFWNVFKGDMSLVGPRPERTLHSQRLSGQIPHYNLRYFSYPGITGWAQINGFRGDTDLRERVNYDLYYLENWSLWLDIKIMLMTFFARKNAY